uniref:Uncharacterized protein n=1 Tax=Acanthochromis polyacanthus TaxID=80966 RepID=A0A3Q1FNB4_9TELE
MNPLQDKVLQRGFILQQDNDLKRKTKTTLERVCGAERPSQISDIQNIQHNLKSLFTHIVRV